MLRGAGTMSTWPPSSVRGPGGHWLPAYASTAPVATSSTSAAPFATPISRQGAPVTGHDLVRPQLHGSLERGADPRAWLPRPAAPAPRRAAAGHRCGGEPAGGTARSGSGSPFASERPRVDRAPLGPAVEQAVAPASRLRVAARVHEARAFGSTARVAHSAHESGSVPAPNQRHEAASKPDHVAAERRVRREEAEHLPLGDRQAEAQRQHRLDGLLAETPVLFFSSRGMCYRMKVWRLPASTPQASGKALINLLPLAQGEVITSILPLPEDTSTWANLELIFATKSGGVRRNALTDFESINRNGKIAMKFDGEEGGETDRIVSVAIASPENDVLLTTAQWRCIRFLIKDEVRLFKGRDFLRRTRYPSR